MNADDFFRTILGLERRKVRGHKGTSPEDYLYRRARRVRPSNQLGQDYVHVTYAGQEYEAARKTWGALDGDKNKSTVLVQTKDSKWRKFWFHDSQH